MADKVEQWITVNGVHIPLFKGDTKESAYKRFIDAQDESKNKQLAHNKQIADNLNKQPVVKSNKQLAQETAKQLINTAKEQDKIVTKDLQSAVTKGSGKLEGLDFRIKSESSLARKLEQKAESKGLTVEQYSKQITDALRYTNVSTPENLANDIRSIQEYMHSKGYETVELVNTMWDNTADYRGINSLMRSPDGYVFELQYHTPQSLEIKEIHHKLYEEARLNTTPQSRKDQLTHEMRKNASAIVTPTNIKSIKDIGRK